MNDWCTECGGLIETVVGPVLERAAASLVRAGTEAYVHVRARDECLTVELQYAPYGLAARNGPSGRVAAEREAERRLRGIIADGCAIRFECEAGHGHLVVASFDGSRGRAGRESCHRSQVTQEWVASFISKAMTGEFD